MNPVGNVNTICKRGYAWTPDRAIQGFHVTQPVPKEVDAVRVVILNENNQWTRELRVKSR